MKTTRAFKYWFLNALVPVAVGALRLLGATLRTRRTGNEHVLNYLQENRAGIAAFLHCDLVSVALWGLEMSRLGRPVTVLTSPSRDGQIFARFLRHLGLRTVQGSSSKGGAQGMLALVHALQAGHHIGIVVDGPRGPRASVKPGVIFLARQTGEPIVALASQLSPAIRLPTWDRAEIPVPLARRELLFAPPWTPPENMDQACDALRRSLLVLKGEAQAHTSAETS